MPHVTSDTVEFFGSWQGPVVATAIHDGHDVRPELLPEMSLDDDGRRREEDPYTSRFIAGFADRVVGLRSRFEFDLNRDRDAAVYRTPQDCWGLELWKRSPLDDAVVTASLALYDAYYTELGRRLDRLAERGPFVLLDVHSYNHRRDGAEGAPADVAQNPEVNIGTGSLDHDTFGGLVREFMTALGSAEVAGHHLDVRENVKFKGGAQSRWAHARYPGVACVLAVEFKKTFMDEWSGEVDEGHIDDIAAALSSTEPTLRAALEHLARAGHRHGR